MSIDNLKEKRLFYERQHFAKWVYFVLFGVAISGLFPFAFDHDWMQAERSMHEIVVALIIATAVPLCLNVLCMHTLVSENRLQIRFGILFPMLWKTWERISLDCIREVRVVVYRPLRDAGGWGWRYGRYDGYSTWFFNAKGDKGVLLIMNDNRRYIIGSQQPESLKAALDSACARAKNR
ncbi:MAG TPA: hypothetical protein ENN29_10235 [Candidatus Hydrogenedentes bacterium]|nr:hypothetical protein [Candidatus Hydrogenedentota bacterium]